MRTFIGIDPGATGAIAWKHPSGMDWGVFDLPVIKVGKQKQMDALELLILIDEDQE